MDYLRRHIEQMKEAVKDGVELMGYTSEAALIWSARLPAGWKNGTASFMPTKLMKVLKT